MNADPTTNMVVFLLARGEGEHAIASAVALPDFYQRMSQLLGDERIVVGLPSPDELAVAGAASGWPETLREMVLSSPYPTGELVPSLLLIDRSGVQLLAERG